MIRNLSVPYGSSQHRNFMGEASFLKTRFITWFYKAT